MITINQMLRGTDGSRWQLSTTGGGGITNTRDMLGLNKTRWNQILKISMEKMASFWHSNMLKKHFTREGALEYQYKARTEKYRKMKSRRGLPGAGRPLVKTGELAYQAQRSHRISGTAKKMTVTLDVPKYLFYRRGTGSDKNLELTTVSLREMNVLVKVADKEISKQAKKG